MRVKWYQRKEHIWIDIEAADIEVEEVEWDDTGWIIVKAKDPKHCLSMQLLHRIHTYDSRWWVSGRCLKMEIAKAEYGLPHWNKLTVGEKLPNVLIDWTSWIDEAEEVEVRALRHVPPHRTLCYAAPPHAAAQSRPLTAASPPRRARHRCARAMPAGCAQIRNAPYGHDARQMASAMGGHWGSNVDRSIRAKAQGQKVNTSNPDDDDDDITMA